MQILDVNFMAESVPKIHTVILKPAKNLLFFFLFKKLKKMRSFGLKSSG
jgi:hypothetical protein